LPIDDGHDGEHGTRKLVLAARRETEQSLEQTLASETASVRATLQIASFYL